MSFCSLVLLALRTVQMSEFISFCWTSVTSAKNQLLRHCRFQLPRTCAGCDLCVEYGGSVKKRRHAMYATVRTELGLCVLYSHLDARLAFQRVARIGDVDLTMKVDDLIASMNETPRKPCSMTHTRLTGLTYRSQT